MAKKNVSNSPFIKLEEGLMKRYAVEKIVAYQTLRKVCLWSLFAFVVFQVTWILSANFIDNLYLKYLLIGIAVLSLAAIGRFTWKNIGRLLPKFIFIGMLGWLFIIVNITPNLIIGDQWGMKSNSDSAGGIKEYSASMPIYRLLSLSDKELQDVDKKIKENILCYPVYFLFPITLINDTQCHPEKTRILDIIEPLESKLFPIVMGILFLILCVWLFRNVSTYRDKKEQKNLKRFYQIDHLQREQKTRDLLITICTTLFCVGYFSLNYIVLFWMVTLLTTIFLFRWEIRKNGKNHKKLSRSVLFVILAQFFSSITGEILFLILLPIYTDIGVGHKLFNLSDTIVLGWLIIFGSAVTVFIGIVTQVVWSGKRMTEKIRS